MLLAEIFLLGILIFKGLTVRCLYKSFGVIGLTRCEKYLLFSKASEPNLCPTQPPIQWVIRSLRLELKQLGHEALHLPPFIANIKNQCQYNSTSVFIPGYRNAAYLFAVLKYHGIRIKNFKSYQEVDFKMVTFWDISS
jgi:hypothetical protein